MTDFRRAGRVVGLFYLAALLCNGIGSELAEAGLGRGPSLAGELLEMLCGVAVLGIGAVVWATFRHHSPALAAGHLSSRIFEAAVNALIIVSTLTALGLSGELREAWLDQRYQAQIMAIFAFSASAATIYPLLHKHRAVPRWLVWWGLAGLVILLAGALADVGGLGGGSLDMVFYGLPLGLNELVLGGWLAVHGFRTPSRIFEQSPIEPASAS
ncbi:DUF4386 domain-containing protein [Paractinoplanes lichenicola]|uniref:DUF4386 domain-containing protein n=1 Tax=Paractinoplanes lichenicola TaxID=2802976 RepID=A0ABS1VT85_9ACTN|nr:DUF4386 domain-containing protein [Actinoplanes lichenicola]MBL7257687.1 DUF4386 domain-containing protein [Actinoplanes lichenicola]